MDFGRLATIALGWGIGLCSLPTLAGTTTGRDTEGSEAASDDCGGICELPDPTATITSPDADAEVAAVFTVTVEATNTCDCDSCGCYEAVTESIALKVDGTVEASCDGCESPHTFELELSPGVHELQAQSFTSWLAPSSEIVSVTVAADGATTGGATTGDATTGDATTGGATTEAATTEAASGAPDPSGAGSTGSAAPGTNDEAGRRGCSAGGDPTGGPLALAGFGVLLLGLRRSRTE